jgi:hypothetical protein
VSETQPTLVPQGYETASIREDLRLELVISTDRCAIIAPSTVEGAPAVDGDDSSSVTESDTWTSLLRLYPEGQALVETPNGLVPRDIWMRDLRAKWEDSHPNWALEHAPWPTAEKDAEADVVPKAEAVEDEVFQVVCLRLFSH